MTMTAADVATDDGPMGPRADRPKRRRFTAEYKASRPATSPLPGASLRTWRARRIARGSLARRSHGSAPSLGARRDRQPLATALTALAHGRRRRYRHHRDARTPVPLPGPRQVGRPRGRRHLGRLHRQDYPRRDLLSTRPPRPLRAYRRTRRAHRHDLRRGLRLPFASTLDPARSGNATRDHPNAPIRHRTGSAAKRSAGGR